MLNVATTHFGRLQQSIKLASMNLGIFLGIPLLGFIIMIVIVPKLILISALFIGLLLGNSNASFLINTLLNTGILTLLIVIIEGVILMTLVQSINKIAKDEPIKIGTIIKNTLRHSGKYVLLCIRIFFYCFLPVTLVIVGLILYPIMKFIVSSGALAVGKALSIGWLHNLVSTFLLIVGCIFFAIRLPRTLLAIHLLAIHDLSAREALQQSIQLSKNRWGAFILHILTGGIATVVARTIINLLPNSTFVLVLSILLDAFLIGFWAIYTYLFLQFITAESAK